MGPLGDTYVHTYRSGSRYDKFTPPPTATRRNCRVSRHCRRRVASWMIVWSYCYWAHWSYRRYTVLLLVPGAYTSSVVVGSKARCPQPIRL